MKKREKKRARVEGRSERAQERSLERASSEKGRKGASQSCSARDGVAYQQRLTREREGGSACMRACDCSLCECARARVRARARPQHAWPRALSLCPRRHAGERAVCACTSSHITLLKSQPDACTPCVRSRPTAVSLCTCESDSHARTIQKSGKWRRNVRGTYLDQRSDDAETGEAQVLKRPRLRDGVQKWVQEERYVRCEGGRKRAAVTTREIDLTRAKRGVVLKGATEKHVAWQSWRRVRWRRSDSEA
eukprot:6195632-Pleurochrysis_carterae.AAC.3